MKAYAIMCAGLLLASVCSPAIAFGEDAAPACAPYKAVADGLKEKYHEIPLARALSGEGQTMMVIFASPGRATWTAVSVRAKDGLACIVAAGTDWQPALPPGDTSI